MGPRLRPVVISPFKTPSFSLIIGLFKKTSSSPTVIPSSRLSLVLILTLPLMVILTHTPFTISRTNSTVSTRPLPALELVPPNNTKVPASEFPDVDPSGHSTASYDFLDFAGNSLDPKLANIQCGQEQTGGYQATGRNYGKCQCGPGCNCLRCTTHPMNPATMEWVQNLYDTMDEEFNDEPAPRSRPQSSCGQPSAAPNIPGEDTESQALDFDLELPQISPMDFDGYSILNFPINGCSNNAECRCGDNCRCEGCLTHSGHVKL